MFDQMLAHVRTNEVDLAARKIEQRMAVEEFSRLDRLERALEAARTHIHWNGGVTAAGSHR